MHLYRLQPNIRNHQALQSLKNPYHMHNILCHAFSPSSTPCPPNTFLWRLEERLDRMVQPTVLVQSSKKPNWKRIPNFERWTIDKPSSLDLNKKLKLNTLRRGKKFRFRLKVNPTFRNEEGKRLGVMNIESQVEWLEKEGTKHGFEIIAQQPHSGYILRGRKKETTVSVYSVIYDGILKVTAPKKFLSTLECGIGRGKFLGMGLFTIFPI